MRPGKGGVSHMQLTVGSWETLGCSKALLPAAAHGRVCHIPTELEMCQVSLSDRCSVRVLRAKPR